MSEEPKPNQRIESSKQKLNDALELHQHVRTMIGLNPFNLLQRIKGGLQNFKNQQAQQTQAQCNTSGTGNPSNLVPTQGAQQVPTNTTSSRKGLFGLGILNLRPPAQQQQPQPPTKEEKAELEKQRRLKETEDRQRREKEKKRRLDLMHGLSVDRT